MSACVAPRCFTRARACCVISGATGARALAPLGTSTTSSLWIARTSRSMSVLHASLPNPPALKPSSRRPSASVSDCGSGVALLRFAAALRVAARLVRSVSVPFRAVARLGRRRPCARCRLALPLVCFWPPAGSLPACLFRGRASGRPCSALPLRAFGRWVCSALFFVCVLLRSFSFARFTRLFSMRSPAAGYVCPCCPS